MPALVTNTFVFIYLLFTKNRKWHHHLFSMMLTALLYIPWIFMMMVQVKKVQHAFWAPEVSLNVILSCFTIPFTEQFWTTGYAKALTILIYVLIVIALLMSISKSWREDRLVLWLAVAVFTGTLLVVAVISMFSQPVLYSRYVMAIVTLLVVPPAVLLTRLNYKWLKMLFTAVILLLGVRVAVSNFGFSYGPYKQTIEYISSAYPDMKKILHITEITAGPLTEYTGNSGLSHYWLKAEMSNVDAFTEVKQFNRPEEFLQKGEEFCAVRFHSLELNMENMERVLSESELIRKDTVKDNKLPDGFFIQLYLLKYKGKNH